MWQRIFYWLADHVYPRFCATCRVEGEDVCDRCLQSLKLDPQWLDIDGLRVWSAYDYHASGIGRIVQTWKYQGADHFLARWLSRIPWPKVVGDVIVPIPLHKRKLLERGFNQAEQLANVLAPSLAIRVSAQGLRRIRYTKAQALCDAALRRTNMTGAFQANPEVVKGKRVVLIDDVVTTGSTLKEAEKALKIAGASEVVAVCLARGG